jgi:serine acetyltransferase
VVLSDVPAGATIMGNPGRIVPTGRPLEAPK